MSRTVNQEATWWQQTHGDDGDLRVAYFSMEFGLETRLAIYSGGLGVLAGDHLKAAADLGLPLVGVGVLYRGGYFVQGLPAPGRLFRPGSLGGGPPARGVGGARPARAGPRPRAGGRPGRPRGRAGQGSR